MKITVISGTEKHGVTYRLKEIFESISRPFCLSLDAAPSCPCNVWKTSGNHNTMLRQWNEICGRGYKAQFILVGDFQNWCIYG